MIVNKSRLLRKKVDMEQEIQYLVEQLQANSSETAPADLQLHLTALLEAKSTNSKGYWAKKSANRREQKIERKAAKH